MITVKKEGIILEKPNYGFEIIGVLTPATIQINETGSYVLQRYSRRELFNYWLLYT